MFLSLPSSEDVLIILIVKNTSEIPDQVGETLWPAQLATSLLRHVSGPRAVKRRLSSGVRRVQGVVLL